MASPFAVLRRNQKTLLAVFGVIIMFVFVVGGSLDDYLLGRSRATRNNQVLVTWKHGQVTEQELYFMRHKHQVTMRFLEEVVKLAQDRKGTPKVPNVTMNELRQMVPGLRRCNATADFVQTLVLAKKAQDLGIVLDDAAVKEFLIKLGGEKLDEGDFAAIIDAIPNRHMTAAQVFEELRLELTAQDVLYMMRQGMFTTSPAIAWKNFNRLHHRVQLEVLPLAVADFLDKVENPTDKEVAEFFEQNKGRYSHPDFPEPGFRQRMKAQFEYLKVDFNQFLEEQKKKITDEDIQKEYDLRVSRGDFRVPELPELPKETPAEGKAEDAKPEEEKPAEDKPAEDKPATEKPASEKPDAKPEEKPAEKPAEKPESEQATPCQDNAEKPAAEKPADEKPASEEKPAAEKPAADKPAADKPAAEEKPAAEGKPAAEEKPAAEGKPADDKAADAKPAAEPKKPRFKPLEEVRDEILTSLARPKAQDAKKKVMDEARQELESFSRWYRSYESFKDTPEESKLGKQTLDPEAIAKRLNLTYGKTPLADPLEMYNQELGKGANFSFAMGNFNQVSFGDIGYRKGLAKYQPEQVLGQDPDIEFLFWKVDERPAREPELGEPGIREEVIRSWKMQKAVAVARKEAEKMAQDAKSKESLSAALGEKVVMTSEFAWMSAGAVPFSSGVPSISRVENVEAAGADFMEAVFKLKAGEVGVAVNQPKSIVYVVRIAAENPSEEALRDRFIASGIANREVTYLSMLDHQRHFAEWYQDLEREMQVKWVGGINPYGLDTSEDE